MVSAAEEAALSLWATIPTVRAAPEDLRPERRAHPAEAKALLASLHRACHADTTPEDSRVAADAVWAAHPVPPPEPSTTDAGAAEGEEAPLPPDGVVPLRWFRGVVEQELFHHWLPPPLTVLDGPLPALVTRPDPRDTEGLRRLQAQTLVECLADDVSGELLPVEGVMTLFGARRTEVPYGDFVTLTPWPAHPAVYTELWQALGAGDALDLDGFTRFVTFVVRNLFGNVTPKRCAVAARPLYEEATRRTGVCALGDFIRLARTLVRTYCRGASPDDFLSALMRRAAAKSAGDVFAFVQPPPDSVLADVSTLHVLDDLDPDTHTAAMAAQGSGNRVVVTGSEGSGKSALGAALAARLNAVHLDAYVLALRAVEDPTSALGRRIRTLVESGDAIPLELQAALIAAAASQPAVEHRGYVLSDLPAAPAGDWTKAAAFMAQCALPHPPQGVVHVAVPPALSPQWRDAARHRRTACEEAERTLRAEAAVAEAAVAAAKERVEARAARRAELEEQRPLIDAGEVTLSEEDMALLEEPEEPEDPTVEELDDEGNPLEPEEAEERAARRQAAERQRRLHADLRRLIDAVRPRPDTEAPPLEHPGLAPVVASCRLRGHLCEVTCVDSPEDAAARVVEDLQLVASVVPSVPPLSEEALEGVDEEDPAQVGEARLRTLLEGGHTLSRWGHFCPVTFAQDGVLVEGTSEFCCAYRGEAFLLASPARLATFIATPDAFTVGTVNERVPLLILQRAPGLLDGVGLSRDAVETAVAQELALTPTPLGSFVGGWRSRDEEAARRTAIAKGRSDSDLRAVTEREERRRKQRELEAKKAKKAAGEKKKGKTARFTDPPPVTEVSAAEDYSGDAAPPTVDESMARTIREQRQFLDRFQPQLVSCLSALDLEALVWLRGRGVLPPTVVLLSHEAPKPPRDEDDDDDDAPEEEEEEEEPVEVEAPVEEGEEPPAPAPKDLSDPRRYARAVLEFVASVDGAEEDTEEPTAGPAPRVARINVHGMTEPQLVQTIVHAARRVVHRAHPVGDDEALGEPEEEEGDDEVDPNAQLTLPGKKPMDTFGPTLKFCPVSLEEEGLLREGDPTIALRYRDRVSLFASQRCLERFQQNPLRYVPTVPPTLPPPRLWVVGPPASGKATLAGSLCDRFGLHRFRLDRGFLAAVLAAAATPGGATVEGIHVPHAAGRRPFDAAAAELRGLEAFEAAQREQQQAKDDAIAAQEERDTLRDDGESVEEMAEEEEELQQKLVDWEPEEEDAKAERVFKAWMRIAASLTRVEPFESEGYVLVGEPRTEQELQQLTLHGAWPEAVVNLRLTPEQYIARRFDAEFAQRTAQYEAEVAQVTVEKRRIATQQRAIEIAKWRRRNLSDETEYPEVDEAPEDPEPVTGDAVRADLEATFEEYVPLEAELTARRLRVVSVNGDHGVETVLRAAVAELSTALEHRRSLLENPRVVHYDEAVELLRLGRCGFSCFRFSDPVRLRYDRAGDPPAVAHCPVGQAVQGEEPEPEPEPEAPAVPRKKLVTRTTEDGEEYEEEEDEEEPEPEEAAEEDEEPEPEPDLAPEELEELQAELDQRRVAQRRATARRCCILRGRAYFFDTEAHLRRFVTEDPLSFWDQAPPEAPVRSVVAVLEPPAPFVGPTTRSRTMAHHLAASMGAVFIDVAKLVKWCLRTPALGALHAQARGCLFNNEPVSDAFLCDAVEVRLRCSDCITNGAVLLNIPRTVAQAERLVRSLPLHKVLTFNGPDPVTAAVDAVARVTHTMEHERFTNGSLLEAVVAALNSSRRRRRLAMCRRHGFPAPIRDTSIPEADLAGARSSFATFCPLMWSRQGQLVDSHGDTQCAAEYLGEVYHFMAYEYLEIFLRDPQCFSGEDGAQFKPLPTTVPTRVPALPLEQVELCGCCPVTLFESRDRRGLKGELEPTAVRGRADLTVEYKGRHYMLTSEVALEAFLRRPWVFAEGAVLPLAHKMPHSPEAIAAATDEVYTRVVLYEHIARAMLAVGEVRPKYPGLAPRESALKYVALHLKAHNPRNTEHRAAVYSANYETFAERATLYKDIALVPPEDEASQPVFRHQCEEWDAVQDQPTAHLSFATLRPPPPDPGR